MPTRPGAYSLRTTSRSPSGVLPDARGSARSHARPHRRHGRAEVPSRYQTTARSAPVRLLAEDDVLISFQRSALVEARSLRPSAAHRAARRFGVSIRSARDAWAAGFHDARITSRGVAAARRLGLDPARLHRQRAGAYARACVDRRRRHLHRPAGPGSSGISGSGSSLRSFRATTTESVRILMAIR